MKNPAVFLATSAVTCVMGATAPTAQATDVYALVIGVDAYKGEFDALEGAVNDAKDIHNALNAIGAKKAILLQDDAADRDKIFSAWKSLTAEAKKGDILVFSYAGHGSQEPEHVPNSESDQRDENLVLGSFAVKGAPTYQRIVDDEISALFRETPDLKIILVADSCHSGTITRGFSGPKKFKKRSIPALKIQDDALKELYGSKSRGDGKAALTETRAFSRAAPAPATEPTMPSHVLSFSGVPDDEEVVEITDPDTKQPRGALSYAFAKALRNAAAQKESTISKASLEQSITETVRMTTEGKQKVQIAGTEDVAIPVQANSTMPAAPVQKPPADFTVFVTNVPESVTETQWKPLLGTAKIATDAQSANASWNISEEKIFSAMGDVIYDGKQPVIQQTRAFSRAKAAPTAVEINYATKVFDKMMVVDRIKQRSEMASPTMTLKPSNQLHRAGAQVSLETSDQQYPYLTLFNLASDGTVNHLYPLKDGQSSDPLQIPIDKPYTLALNVEPPYGGDHFVVIFSDKPLEGLHKALAEMNGGQHAAKIEAALDRALEGMQYQIGVHGVFTGP